jgi:hypothetical protein
VQRITGERKDGSKYNAKSRREMQDMQIKLMGYAPAHSAIYTITYNKTRASRYQYTDVFCINNNRLFKITKIVAYILGFKMHKPDTTDRPAILWSVDCMRVRTFREYAVLSKKDMVTIEIELVKMLSTKMFGVDDSYHHESVLLMSSEFERKIEEIPNHTKKSYIAKSV